MNSTLRRRFALGATAACFALVAPNAARADDWLVARHDAQRTGACGGRSNLDTPSVQWAYYLGGALSDPNFVTANVDADPEGEVIYVTAGKVVAKDQNDTVVWETPLLEVTGLVGLYDLDGDGKRDVIATASRGGVYAFDSTTGATEWALPSGVLGEVGGVRLADLDGDGKQDLVVLECGCCTLNSGLGAAAYSFAAGFANAAQLWTVNFGHCGASSDVVADVTGDGVPDLLATGRPGDIAVFQAGATVSPEASIPAPASGEFYPATDVLPVNLDADPAMEVVAVSNGFLAATQNGARRVAVFDYQSDGTWTELWEDALTDRANGSVAFSQDLVADLDGDGTRDIAYGLYDPASGWTLTVRNLATGALLAQKTGSVVRGAADLDADGKPEIITVDGDDALHAYRFANNTLTSVASAPHENPLSMIDPDARLHTNLAWHVSTLQLDADPALELLVADYDPAVPAAQRQRTSLSGLDYAPPALNPVAHFMVDAPNTIIAAQPNDRAMPSLGAVLTVTSDGYLEILDRAFMVTNRNNDPEFPKPGMRVGGYYSGVNGLGDTPVVGRVGASTGIFVRDSRGSVIRLDSAGATLARTPRPAWQSPNKRYPALIDTDGDGAREVVSAVGQTLYALDPNDGHTLWSTGFSFAQGGTYVVHDVLPARRSGFAGSDLLVTLIDPGSIWHPARIDGATHALRWGTYTRILDWGLMQPAAADLNADGTDDMVSITNSATWVNGADGTDVASQSTSPHVGTAGPQDSGEFTAYAEPMVADFDGDGAADVWENGGYYPERLRHANLGLSASPTAYLSAPHSGGDGALVRCGTRMAVVAGAASLPDLWTVVPMEVPADTSVRAHVVLAGGEVYPAGTSPATRPGYVGTVSAVADLDGNGHPGVLVGSTDGWLYALDPCTLAKLWSLNFRAPVGEPVIADADGNGVDDVLVTAADGYLYALSRLAYGSPAPVNDTDPAATDPTADVDMIDTVDSLHAHWSAVAGAAGYVVSVRTDSGTPLTYPTYIDVPGGNTVAYDFGRLPLRQGGRYVVSVRAYGPNGGGVEANSDGVVVTSNSPVTLTLTATPASFAPSAGQTTTVNLHASNRSGLTHSHVEVQSQDGTRVRTLEDVDIAMLATDHSFRGTWDGRSDADAGVSPGNYLVVATVRDVANHMAMQSTPVMVLAQPADAGAGDAGAGDAAMSGDGGMMDGGTGGGGGGCGCSVPGGAGEAGGRAGGLFVVVALGALVRRRRGRARA